jgi:hypothetical protein
MRLFILQNRKAHLVYQLLTASILKRKRRGRKSFGHAYPSFIQIKTTLPLPSAPDLPPPPAAQSSVTDALALRRNARTPCGTTRARS